MEFKHICILSFLLSDILPSLGEISGYGKAISDQSPAWTSHTQSHLDTVPVSQYLGAVLGSDPIWGVGVAAAGVADPTQGVRLYGEERVEQGDFPVGSQLGGTNSGYLDTITDSFEKLRLGVPVILPDIRYDGADEHTLLPAESSSLKVLLDILQKHPELNIDLRSHTGSRGAFYHNQRVSERKAKALVAYLMEHGVAGRRINSGAFGDSYPLISCGDSCSITEQQLNGRTEVVFFQGRFFNRPYTYPSHIGLDGAPVQLGSRVKILGNSMGTGNQEPDSTRESGKTDYYYLVAGSFRTLDSAYMLANKLGRNPVADIYIIPPIDGQNRFRVAVSRYGSSDEAAERLNYYRHILHQKELWLLYLEMGL